MLKRLPVLVVTLALVAVACGGDSGASASAVWARPSAPGQTSSAVYFDLTVAADDRLIGASVDSSVAAEAQIHEVVAADGEHDMDDDMSMDDMSMDEMSSMEGSDDMDMSMDDADHEMDHSDGSMAMRMQELTGGLELTGGETVSFEPGGYHVMMPTLTRPLVAGDEFDLTLSFEAADDLTITVMVSDTAP